MISFREWIIKNVGIIFLLNNIENIIRKLMNFWLNKYFLESLYVISEVVYMLMIVLILVMLIEIVSVLKIVGVDRI